jgi:hypothetical protein
MKKTIKKGRGVKIMAMLLVPTLLISVFMGSSAKAGVALEAAHTAAEAAELTPYIAQIIVGVGARARAIDTTVDPTEFLDNWANQRATLPSWVFVEIPENGGNPT